MKSEIRLAEPRDLLDIVDMGREFFEQSGNGAFTTFDEPSFTATAIGLISGVANGALLIAESGITVGMAAHVVFPFYANMNTKISQEIFWFVKPDFRNGIGSALLDELEADAKRRGADVFMSASIAGLRDGAIARVYERRGYKPAEHTFLRKLSS